MSAVTEKAMKGKKTVCITGMERSGTSMVARVVNLLGVSLGPEDRLILETEYNEKGCWEAQSLLEINDEILKRFGGSSHEPPELGEGWELDPRLRDLEEKGRRVLEKDFGGLSAWGWKDTRSSITLPFWQKMLPDMEYVICVRNPLDVVNSLLKRKWSSSFAGAFHIWLVYTASAVRNTRGGKRIIVFYDEFMGEGLPEEASRLAEFLGPEYSERLQSAMPEIRSFISVDLRHHKTTLVEMFENTEIPFVIKAYYALLLRLARGGAEDELILDAVSADVLRAEDKEAEMMRLKNAVDVKSARVEALESSLSWRITAPLRALYDMLFGRFSQGR